MIEVFINNQAMLLAPSTNITQALEQIKATPPFAVALNLQFVPRSAYGQTYLQAGDKLEVVQPITGG